jgi:hypothetical protein
MASKAKTLRDKDDEALQRALADARGALDRRSERDANYARAEASRPDIRVGDVVIVSEPGITDELGIVHSLKYSGPLDAWYAEVRYDRDGLSRAVPAQYINVP